jgi:hypothetical protein
MRDFRNFRINLSKTIVLYFKYGRGECQGYQGTDHVSLPSSGIDVIMSMLFVDAESDMQVTKS